MAATVGSHTIASLRVSASRLRASTRSPAVHKVAQLAISARQGAAVDSSAVVSAVNSAVDAVLGENRSLRLQGAAIMAFNALVAMPALAEEEKGAIFDFNLTLPIMVVQFLLLMVALDKIWFKPVSEVMDKRDGEIRNLITNVRGNSEELKQLQDESEAVIKSARAETAAMILKAKKETAAELDAKLQASRSRIEKELATALANLEKQKNDTMTNLDSQVSSLSDQIVKKVVPFKF